MDASRTLVLALLAFLLPLGAEANCIDKSYYKPIAERYSKGLLFTVYDCLQATPPARSYIFGTFHSDSKRVDKISKQAYVALKEVKQAAFEVVMDNNTSRASLQAMTIPPYQPGLREIIGQDWYEKLVVLAKKLGTPPPLLLPRLKPWAAAVLLQYPPSERDGAVLDAALQLTAKQSGVKVHGLETPDEQFHVFDSLNTADQLQMLYHTIDNADKLPSMQEEIANYYLDEDLNGLMATAQKSFEEIPDERLAEHLRHELIDRRNITMALRAGPLLQKQPTLIAVGALHLPGKKGLLALLERRGFQIYPARPR